MRRGGVPCRLWPRQAVQQLRQGLASRAAAADHGGGFTP